MLMLRGVVYVVYSVGYYRPPGTYSYWAYNPVNHEIRAKTRKGNKKI